MHKFSQRELMIDFARNGVLKVTEVQKIVLLAKRLKINRIGIYLETPPSPSFIKLSDDWEGLSKKEWRKITSFAQENGVVVYPYIETLAHMEKLLSLKPYIKFQHPKSHSTINPTSKEVYSNLIEPLIVHTVESFRNNNRRLAINIGCDEAEAIKNPEEFVQHLNIVSNICKKYSLDCSAWADGAMKLQSQWISKINTHINFTYWKYPSHDTETIAAEIKSARAKGLNITAAAASTFSHNQFYPLYKFASANIKAIVEGAKANNLEHVILTEWFDDNAEAPFRASLPSLIYFSSIATNTVDETRVLKSFKKIAANPWNTFELLSSVNFHDAEMSFSKEKDFLDPAPNPIKFLVFENPQTIPFTRKIDTNFNPRFSSLFTSLLQIRNEIHNENLILYKYTLALTNYLRIKSDLGKKVRQSYKNYLKTGDVGELEAIIKELQTAKKRLRVLQFAHKKMWMAEKKPRGWLVLRERYENTRKQLTELVDDLSVAIERGNKVDYLLAKPRKIKSKFPLGNRKYEEIVSGN